MNYKKCYDNLIETAKKRDYTDGYYEKHHIIPKCVGGNNGAENIVKLRVKEHYVAHHLLVKIYYNTEYRMKLICAFRYMSVDSHNGNRMGLQDIEYMRKLYAENHPTKNKEIAEKISIGVRKYYASLSEEENQARIKKSVEGMKKFYANEPEESKRCRSERIRMIQLRPEVREKRISSLRKFYENESEENKKIRQEEYKKNHPPEMYIKSSISIKKFINKLTKEEQIARLDKSLRTADPIQRGLSISAGKKGKQTNQQTIMGKRYASMTDEEFELFLKEKKTKTAHKNDKIEK
jgi:hypothetical protein